MRSNIVKIESVSSTSMSHIFWPMMIIMAAFLYSQSAVSAVNQHASYNQHTLLKQQAGWQATQQIAKLESAREAFSDEEVHLSYRLLQPLAMQGHTLAQYQLATLHDSEQGAYSSLAKAAYWYQKAAKNGHKDAQHNLAVAYANGDGLEQDINKALQWWKRAALAGHIDAQYNLGIIYATGKGGVESDLGKAAKWWRLAAIGGDPMAQYNLAALFANGIESVRSYCEATRWWEKSAANGFSQANVALAAIKQKQDYTSCWE